MNVMTIKWDFKERINTFKMKNTAIIIILILNQVMAYSGIPDTTLKTVNKDIQDWFEEGNWYNDFGAEPDGSIDVNALYTHYRSHRHLWEMVFKFLSENVLDSLDMGRYTLAGDSLFALIDEYATEDVSKRKYEAHRKYIDLQYVFSGQEMIGIAGSENQEIIEPFDDVADIAFYRISDGTYRLADEKVFFIFFPTDAHQPCVSANQSTHVKKIVFKILSDY